MCVNKQRKGDGSSSFVRSAFVLVRKKRRVNPLRCSRHRGQEGAALSYRKPHLAIAEQAYRRLVEGGGAMFRVIRTRLSYALIIEGRG